MCRNLISEVPSGEPRGLEEKRSVVTVCRPSIAVPIHHDSSTTQDVHTSCARSPNLRYLLLNLSAMPHGTWRAVAFYTPPASNITSKYDRYFIIF